ncbi:heparinase II/III domain-containing protein [Paenibacillus sedimenti]|uniref:Heparinase II/III family protein n=1 Tax=Paenibacillus sedimenti TaxID=2770274 RepID=A0A926QKU8_9BACL|nr:heparinase II/III family protein [Paenibacillus sedimenti]MBD0382168.1 heparinase II/III family protein [Paenibacillus sedimenti]
MNEAMNAAELQLRLSDVKLSPSGLLFGDSDPEQVRKRLIDSDESRTLVAEIRQEAEVLLQESMPELTYLLFRLFAETGSRSEYERVYFRRRKRLTAFGLMAWLEPESEVYTEALREVIWSILDEYTWCLPAHILHGPEMLVAEGTLRNAETDALTIDLFAAETAFALSEIAALHGDALPLLLRARIRAEVLRRVLRPFATQSPFGWETATHNWASVCGGSIAAAAIYTLPDEEELAAVLGRAFPALASYLRGFEADGACTEGYMYWQYGFGFFVYAADLIKRRTGGAVDWFADDKVREIALFQQKCFMDGRHVVNFSDSLGEAGIFMGLSSYLKRLYPEVEMPEASLRAGFNDDHCSRWAPAVRNLLWLGEEAGSGAGWTSATYYLPDAQWLVSRQVRTDGEGSYVFAAKGGHNDEPHNHNDIGQFMLYAGGEALLTDLGSGQYTREYFGAGRYDILCNGAQGHSVPVVNGRYQRAGAQARAELMDYSSTGERDVFHIEFSSAYAEETLQILRRRFIWNKSELPYLELIDTFEFSEAPDAISERFMSWHRPEQAEDGRVRIGTDAEAAVALYIDYDPDKLGWRVEKLLHIDHFGKQVECYALDFSSKQLPVKGQSLSVEAVFTFTFSD